MLPKSTTELCKQYARKACGMLSITVYMKCAHMLIACSAGSFCSSLLANAGHASCACFCPFCEPELTKFNLRCGNCKSAFFKEIKSSRLRNSQGRVNHKTKVVHSCSSASFVWLSWLLYGALSLLWLMYLLVLYILV